MVEVFTTLQDKSLLVVCGLIAREWKNGQDGKTFPIYEPSSANVLHDMDLGGNAPFIVFDDADIDQPVEGTFICNFRCSGQTCVCANRLLVHEKVPDEFIEKLVQLVKLYKLGRGIDKGNTQGLFVNAAAVKKCGVTAEMEVAHDENFGPLAAIFSFKSEAEAVDLANTIEYGLAGYFFNKDISHIMRIARHFSYRMLGVNTGLISTAKPPSSSVKESGLGREGSKYGLAEYQNIKSVTIGNLALQLKVTSPRFEVVGKMVNDLAFL
ncbi:succinate-semialdehyde dehdyrogenase [Colletotrichum incanum]|uniref:Succinate-semialdehyde dehydrogenase, mitochondrial n=1 Tax=Colletotrichum incanum TaxID=1573173 RepID=A0A167B481_COLIC|nr:succinate-semialdehyde dehdyrogenase [Colletotrichum incanum]